jgi:hypothetical protein
MATKATTINPIETNPVAMTPREQIRKNNNNHNKTQQRYHGNNSNNG